MVRRRWIQPLSVFTLALFLFGSASAGNKPTTRPADPECWLLHLPGVGGELHMDRQLVAGMKQGGWPGDIQVYDWTQKDPGLDALRNMKRNKSEAHKIAKMLAERARDNPDLQITITAHSGGTAIAVWALEELPDDVQVRTVVLLASALSPQYDLTAALRHVRGKMYVFYSENDALVLGAGTRMFGTMDGMRCNAAGMVGFSRPADADEAQYRKLTQKPYDPRWMKYENDGTHIGCMSREFVAHVLAPILESTQNAGR